MLGRYHTVSGKCMTLFECTGWVEVDGTVLSLSDVEKIVKTDPGQIRRFGGEFAFSFGSCHARDHFGIVRGPGQKGAVVCNGQVRCLIEPAPAPCTLDEAIVTAVRIRSGEGVTALSGGVDSSLVAALAGRECVAVGLKGSHDLERARHAADLLGLTCTEVEITQEEIADALPAVIAAIPKKDPVNTSIAVTQYFIARWAGEHGHRRILAGQGADELVWRIRPLPRVSRRWKRILPGTLPDWKPRLTVTRQSLPFMARTSPCPIWISVSCAPHARSRPMKRCMTGSGRSPCVRSQGVISRRNWQYTAKKPCSTGAGSGEY